MVCNSKPLKKNNNKGLPNKKQVFRSNYFGSDNVLKIVINGALLGQLWPKTISDWFFWETLGFSKILFGLLHFSTSILPGPTHKDNIFKGRYKL